MNYREREIAAWGMEREGTINFTYRSHRGTMYLPRVRIGCTSKELLEAFQRIIKVGKVLGPYKHKGGRYKPLYLWHLGNMKTIRDFLKEIPPYLITKRPQAERMLHFCESRISRGLRSYTPYSEEELTDVLEVYELNSQ